MTYLTYDGQLRSETDPQIIATLLRKGWVEAPQPTYDPATETCQWVDGAWVVAPIVIPVPEQVSMWALREAVMFAGEMTAVANALNGLPEPQRSIGWNRWEYKESIMRSSPIITMLQQELAWTDSFVDGLYQHAAAIAQNPN
jgi:hypothetical protein